MKNIIIITVFLFIISCSSVIKKNHPLDHLALITKEYISKDGNTSSKYRLIKYIFKKGKIYSKEELKGLDDQTSAHFDSQSTILHNRYIISYSGDIFDLKTDTLFFNSIGFDFPKEILEHKIIFKKNSFPLFSEQDSIKHASIKSLYYYYDLKSKKIVEFNSGDQYRSEGVLSNDKKLGLEFVIKKNTTIPYDSIGNRRAIGISSGELILHQFNKKPKKILSNLSIQIDRMSSMLREIPILWIDESNFLTQKANGKLLLVSLNGEVKTFPVLEDALATFRSPKLFKTSNGNIIYTCSTNSALYYLVDIKNIQLKLPTEPKNHEKLYILKQNASILNSPTKLIPHDSLLNKEYATYKNIMAINSLKGRADNIWKSKSSIKIYDTSGKLIISIDTKLLTEIIGWVDHKELTKTNP